MVQTSSQLPGRDQVSVDTIPRAIINEYCHGASVTALAQAHGISRDRVLEILRRAGFYDAETTKRPSDALKGRREALAQALLDDALMIREQLWQEHTIMGFFGKDAVWCEQTVDRPDVKSQLDILRTVESALKSVKQLADWDGGTRPQTVNLLLATAEALGVKDGE